MDNDGIVSVLKEYGIQPIGDSHRAVLTACTSHSYGKLFFSFLFVQREHKEKILPQTFYVLMRLREGEYIRIHLLLETLYH